MVDSKPEVNSGCKSGLIRSVDKWIGCRQCRAVRCRCRRRRRYPSSPQQMKEMEVKAEMDEMDEKEEKEEKAEVPWGNSRDNVMELFLISSFSALLSIFFFIRLRLPVVFHFRFALYGRFRIRHCGHDPRQLILFASLQRRTCGGGSS